MNDVTVSGTLVFDANVYTTADGTDIGSFKMHLEDDKREHKSQIGVAVFGDRVEEVRNLRQYDHVVVTGYLNENRWKDKKTGEWKREVQLRAMTIQATQQEAVGASQTTFSDDDIPF